MGVRVLQVWPGLSLNTALTPNSGMRSVASAVDGSRMERELSSPYTSSVMPPGQVSALPTALPRAFILIGTCTPEGLQAQLQTALRRNASAMKCAC